MGLHGFVDHAIDHFAGVKFGPGRGRAHRCARVFEKGGIVQQGARGFDFGVHVGQHPLNGLEFTDGFAEGLSGARIFCGFVEGTLSQPDSLRGNANAAAIKRRRAF